MAYDRRRLARAVKKSGRQATESGYLAGIPVFSPDNVEFSPGTFLHKAAEQVYGGQENGDPLFLTEKQAREKIPEGSAVIRGFTTERPWRGKRRMVLVCGVPVGNCDMTLRCIHKPCGDLALERLELLRDTMFNLNWQTTSAEFKALRLLRRLVSDYEYDGYLLSGNIEVEGKSGVTYLLRKNRPILAFRATSGPDSPFKSKLLCALCLHPLGYYRGSFAGVMCPTDEIITQLLLIRSDEHFLWRKSNQHPVSDPRSGFGF